MDYIIFGLVGTSVAKDLFSVFSFLIRGVNDIVRDRDVDAKLELARSYISITPKTVSEEISISQLLNITDIIYEQINLLTFDKYGLNYWSLVELDKMIDILEKRLYNVILIFKC